MRERRRLARVRTSLVRMRSRLQCQVHALLADHGVHPPVGALFGPTGRRFLAEVPLPAVGRVDAWLRFIDALAAEVATLDRELKAAFGGDERLPRLLPIPGIGFLIACVVLAEVGDVTRLRSADELCSWAGLTPTERSSADHVRRGHISKQGSRWLRWVMVEAAQRARDPQLLRFFNPIERRRGSKIARVALARRILTLCFYALRDEGGAARPSPRAHPRVHGASVQARSPTVMASPRGDGRATDRAACSPHVHHEGDPRIDDWHGPPLVPRHGRVPQEAPMT